MNPLIQAGRKRNVPRASTRTTEGCRGSALLVVIFVLLMASAIGMALTYSGIYEVRLSRNYKTGSQAFYLAEAGLNHAVKVIKDNSLSKETLLAGADGTSGTSDDGILAGSYVPSGVAIPSTGVSLGGGSYRVSMTDGGGNRIIVTSTATGENNSTAGVEAILDISGSSSSASNPNIPCAGVNTEAAALSYLGDFDKKAQLQIHVKQHKDDENGDGSDDSSSPIAIDGGNNAPGVAIEDSVTYDKITENIGKRLHDGKLQAGAITGIPMVTIGKNGKTGVASFSHQTNPILSSDAMDSLGDNMLTSLEDMILHPTTTVSGGTVHHNSSQSWGASSSSITYVTADHLHMDNGSVINGQGTLIVSGDLQMHKGSQLNWVGNIFVLGGTNKDAVLQNNKGHLNVNGNIVILGTDGNKKRSIFKLKDDDHDTSAAANVINGSVIILTGNRTDKDEKAEFSVSHGDTTIDGLVSLVGDKLKFEAKLDDDASFTVDGGVAVAVPNIDRKHKAKVHLHGENILIKYNRDKLMAAVTQVNQMYDAAGSPMLPMLTPPTLSKISWRELRN